MLLNLPTLAGLWTVFGPGQKPANLGRFMDTFRSAQCDVHKPAYLGRFMDTFRSSKKVTINLLTLAVLWTSNFSNLICTQTCIPWQVYGHFSVEKESDHKPADLGRFMDINFPKFNLYTNLQTLAGLWTFFGLQWKTLKTSLIGLRTFERGREHLEDYRKEAEDSHVVIDVFDDIENLDSTTREGTPPLDLLLRQGVGYIDHMSPTPTVTTKIFTLNCSSK